MKPLEGQAFGQETVD